MKQRVISGIFIAAILLSVWWFAIETIIFDIFFALLAAAACYELTKCIGVPNVEMKVVSIILSFAWVLGLVYPAYCPVSAVAVLYVIFLAIMTVIKYPEIKFEHLAGTVYASLVIPTAFAMGPIIADLYKTYDFLDKMECKFFIFLVVAGALFTDVFAQLSGMAFGKHKATPQLSPKKTVEGCVGGVVCALALNLLWYFLYVKFFATQAFSLPIWLYCIISIAMSVASMFGDLIASLIKRNYDIKDYSHLIPGHGGIMDRFDSVIMVMPMFYAIFTIYGSVVA